MSEVWKDIPGYEGLYQVSSEGRVKSAHRRNGEDIILMVNFAGRYGQVTLCKNKKRRGVLVHHIVAQVFKGDRPVGHDVCHDDGNRRNNSASNLVYKTKRDNELDKRRHGTALVGTKNPLAKLTDADVIQIRKAYLAGEAQVSIARKFNVSQANISNIILGKVWTHV